MTERWWERPFRIFQTTIREIDAGLDVNALADDVVGFGANAWLRNAAPCWKEWSRSVISALSRRVREFIETRNPNVALVQRLNASVLFHEVNNAVDRPLPLWRYWAGDVARESRMAFPDRPVGQNAVTFLDIPDRFSAEQPGLVGLDLQQTIAQGVNPYASTVGITHNQPDRKNFLVVRRMRSFHRDHQDVYAGLRSTAQVAIISSLRSSERLARALVADTELHVTGGSAGRVELTLPRLNNFDVIVLQDA